MSPCAAASAAAVTVVLNYKFNVLCTMVCTCTHVYMLGSCVFHFVPLFYESHECWKKPVYSDANSSLWCHCFVLISKAIFSDS